MIKRLTPWVFLLLLLCIPRSAQSQTASITGTVKDSTGAAVPQAKVTTHNRATSSIRSAITDDSGIYRITSLSPGNYDVVIERRSRWTMCRTWMPRLRRAVSRKK